MTQIKTIVAISTSPGVGGIGVIRISGPQSRKVLKRLWRNRRVPVDNFATHRIYLGKIVNPSTEEFLDNCLCVWMRAPHSYTGEDVIEIQGHGSPLLMEKILSAALEAGAILALPGEFTKRAYLNGKIDLAQAEAVADVISASSEAGLAQAKEHLTGRFSKRISEFRSELVRLRAFVEASVDFPEEDIEMIQKEGILNRLSPIQVALTELLSTYHEGRLHREGVRTILVGRPNAGKSSLLNALLGSNRAIVHHVPGTTRDVIEEGCLLGGYVFRLFDTAGLRKTTDEVESIGVARSEELIENADLILWVIDASSPLSKEDVDYLSKLDFSKTLLCLNKIDLGIVWNPESFLLNKKEKEMLSPISALRGDGLKELQNSMVNWVKRQSSREAGGMRITKLRHKEALGKSLQALGAATNALQQRIPVELVALHLRKAHEALGEITGSDIDEELLDTIFSEFCIGK
ncbi:MAG: tRNA uridine-5-carboxymethylaminomethyl(34) synthesis GTPase MnmE [Deltaproteobacteria bacterium]|nr:tRNA uridine-5-carboxymethylaminomethyl(34) synthesis GTPase MnmE [Deltaproteobacteria bacterium]